MFKSGPAPVLAESRNVISGLEYEFVKIVVLCFYRAMHFSAKRGIAIACRLSVCPSVRL